MLQFLYRVLVLGFRVYTATLGVYTAPCHAAQGLDFWGKGQIFEWRR